MEGRNYAVVIGREREEALKFYEERDISEGERNYKVPTEERGDCNFSIRKRREYHS